MTEVPWSADDDQLLFTFRVLRCAIVAAALVLDAALVIEAARTGSIRGSISAYFYSSVRSIFVGCLMAIGVCLIAIQAKTVWEETLAQPRRAVRLRRRARYDSTRRLRT